MHEPRKHADSDGKYRRPNSRTRRRYRALLMEHQGGCCYWCRCSVEHGELDRVWPGKFGGTYRFDNLVLACTECNKARGLTDARQVTKKEARAILAPELRILRRRKVVAA